MGARVSVRFERLGSHSLSCPPPNPRCSVPNAPTPTAVKSVVLALSRLGTTDTVLPIQIYIDSDVVYPGF